MRWLILGGDGQLGRALAESVAHRCPEDTVWAPSRSALDIRDQSAVLDYVKDARPELIINAVAWTDVDGAEAQPDLAFAANAFGAETIAECLSETGIGHLIHISTDYVFDGSQSGPYGEGDPASPVNTYGVSKLLGEQLVLQALPGRATIMRTAWLYSAQGRNFVKSILAAVLAGRELRVVDDQRGHPTWASDVARRIIDVRHLPPEAWSIAPVLHAVNSGLTSWFGLAQEVVRLSGNSPERVLAIPTHELQQPAARPGRVELTDDAASRLGLPPMRPWQQALEQALPSVLGSVLDS
jgi:dTDP-4-dehydrorhamnose reductase